MNYFKTALCVVLLICAPLSLFAQDVVLNEIMASNSETIADEDGDFEDWIELYNSGNDPVSLTGYGLSDDYDNPFRWVFPDVTIEPGEFLLIWASGKDRDNPSEPLHTNFSISAGGEEVLITDTDGNRIDEHPPTEIPTDISYGRSPDGSDNWIFFDNPSPNSSNGDSGFEFLLSQPQFSQPAGFYTSEFSLSIESPDEDVIIYYTTDGSEPTEDSEVYEGPITITDRSSDPNDISLIPTNNISGNHQYDEDWREPTENIFKINTIRAIAVKPGSQESPIATASYIIHDDGANRFSLPVFSITTNREHFFSDETGIYVHGNSNNYQQRGVEWERPVHIELFEENGDLALSQAGGVRIHGGTSRNRPRKTLRLYARGSYGKSWFNYPFFPDKEVTEYKRLLLRNSGNDWRRSLFRDAFMQSLMKDVSNLDMQYSRASLVFINGEYWGIHNMRDRLDHHYIYSHYGIEEHEMTMMENNRVYDRGDESGVSHFNDMFDVISNQNMAQNTNYEYITTQMDVDNFIDYQTAQIYYRNTDWPGNNLAYWRYNSDYNPNADGPRDGRWRWMMFDVDFGFNLNYDYVGGRHEGAAHNTLEFALQSGNEHWPNPDWSTRIFRNLMQNQNFRNSFINRFADLMNTVFDPAHVEAQIDSFRAVYEPEIDEHIQRWNHPDTKSDWENEISSMKSFARDRTSFMREFILDRFNLNGMQQVTVSISDQQGGKIKLNTLSISENSWSGMYFQNVPITITAIPNEGYIFAGWEGDVDSDSEEIEITLNDNNISLTANFVQDVESYFPPAFNLSSGAFSFTEWSTDAEAGSFPANMSFVYMEDEDPGLYAQISGETSGIFNLDNRTRINGLGEDGISFINTGNSDGNPGYPGTQLGGAIVALDTRGEKKISLSFDAGTLAPNSRVYHLRLQYRIGGVGAFSDVMKDGEPVEYKRNSTAGHSQSFTSIVLPEEIENQEYVQLLWRYYYTDERLDEDSGQRTQIRLDNIFIPGIIEAPELQKPVDEAVNLNPQITLEWQALADVDFYDIQLSDDENFSNLIIDSLAHSSNTFTPDFNLDFGETYFWRIRAGNDREVSEWSSVFTFSTVQQENGFVSLTTPRNNATGLALQPSLSWSSDFSGDFRIQISEEVMFESTLIDSIIADKEFSFPSPLENMSTYYWRVKAHELDDANWSTTWNFTTIISPPGSVSLAQPTMGDSDLALMPTLTWLSAERASSYELQITETLNFESTVLDTTAIQDTTFTLTSELEYLSEYRWRIRAVNDGGKSSWTTPFLFTTAPPPPAPVELRSPANDTLISDLQPFFEWNERNHADYYRFQLSDEPNFSSAIIDSNNIVNTSFMLDEDLDQGTIYFWRVRASNDSGDGDFSPIFIFTTETITSTPTSELPNELVLRQNYPNPFNPVTQISFGLPAQSEVTITVYNVLGRRVAVLVNSTLAAGWHTVPFDASQLSSGVYIYQISTPESTISKKMGVVK